MSPKLQEIRKKMAKLEKEADELKRLKSDYTYAKQFRKMLVKQQMDQTKLQIDGLISSFWQLHYNVDWYSLGQEDDPAFFEPKLCQRPGESLYIGSLSILIIIVPLLVSGGYIFILHGIK